jgi:hypothetical protein
VPITHLIFTCLPNSASLQELNDHPETCRFVQTWITPDRRGHTPQYGSSTYTKQERHNTLLRILGGTGAAPAWPGLVTRDEVALYQDANVIVSESDAGTAFKLPLAPARQGERGRGGAAS